MAKFNEESITFNYVWKTSYKNKKFSSSQAFLILFQDPGE
jgi:hypothetical protein